jgi:phosphoribosyl-ATP pyrophosphohydrolase/phosphoribosyl-AMP cyclohydrolase
LFSEKIKGAFGSREHFGETMIYCSIDLMGGKGVQLVQGKAEKKKLEVTDVMGLALRFSKIGPINVIDLDAALEQGDNTEIILSLAKQFPIRVGGGIGTVGRAQRYIEAGVQKIIIGSKALDPVFMEQLLQIIPRDKIIIALDSFKDEIVIRGWKEKTQVSPEEVIQSLEPYCSEFLYTQVEREGLMKGPDFERLKKLRRLTSHPLVAAGGISSLDEIAMLEADNISSVLGMALYTGKINYTELLKFFQKRRTLPDFGDF